MPGLVAIIADPGRPDLGNTLDAMLAALAQPGHRVTRLVLPEMGVALGHVRPARFADRGGMGEWEYGSMGEWECGRTEAPIFPHSHSPLPIALLDGEPLDLPAIAGRLGLPADAAAAAIVAALYDRDGADALGRLDGHWAVAIADPAAGRVVIANDPFGIRPLYRTRAADGDWLIASHPAALLAYPGVPRRLDPAGLADYLAFGFPWGRKTFFEGIEILPAASLLTFAAGQVQARRYWTPVPAPRSSYALADLEELRQLFNANVGRVLALGRPFSLALTGGLDARLVLSSLVAAGIRPHTLIHTVPGSTDALVAAELARVAGAEHHFFEVRGEDLPAQFRPGIRLLGGLVARPDIHPLCFLDELTQFTQVMLTGHGGDLPRREYAATKIDPRRHTRADVAEAIFAYYNRYNTMLSVGRDFPLLIAPDWLPALQAQPARSIQDAMTDVNPTVPLDDIGLVVEVQEYLPKYWAKGDLLVRRELETRHPLVDRAFLARAWRLPKRARAEAVVHRYILSRNAPALADVPYERNNLPVRYPFSRGDRWRQHTERWQATLRSRFGQPYLRTPNYRYADWIRGPLRPLFSEVLLDPRTLGRPYLRGETVRRWFDEHIAGQDHATRLMVLLDLELSVRTFIENDVS